jgi:hypothetical protein
MPLIADDLFVISTNKEPFMTRSNYARRSAFFVAVAAVAVGGLSLWAAEEAKKWEIHDMNRPKPPIVTPAPAEEQAAKAPSDAVVLFDGTNLDQWVGGQWKIENGYMQVTKGELKTRDSFGSCQLHIEWMSPSPAKGEGQGRGNSGIFLMSKYELQVLDSFDNVTYADGQAASIYGQYPPLVNASRAPGQWQSYDVVFHAPKFKEDGSLASAASITVLHNGVLAQDNSQIMGGTGHHKIFPYEKHDKLPITLQDHGQPVRYRNVWLRPLAE